jgi:GT2 family glycosyltransferase
MIKIDDICGNKITETNNCLIHGYYEQFVIYGSYIKNSGNRSSNEISLSINGKDYSTYVYPHSASDAIVNTKKINGSGFIISIPFCLVDDINIDVRIEATGSSKNFSCKITRLPSKYISSIEDCVDNPVFKELSDFLSIIRNKERDLLAMKHSLSWQLTFPLRKIRDFLRLFIHVFRRAFLLFNHGGFKLLYRETVRFLKNKGHISPDIYSDYDKYTKETKRFVYNKEAIIAEIKTFKIKPVISVIVPVYNVQSKWLNRCIQSVQLQFYQQWELCLYDDCSTSKDTLACLRSWQGKDKRIKVSFGKQNRHISYASNKAIEMTKGEYIGLLDHDDELTPDALFEMVKQINTYNNVDFIYSDEDKLEMDGTLSGPFHKPDFNLDLFLTNNYICHFSVIRKSIGDKIGWFREGYEGSQDYDLFLRIIQKTRNIFHVPKVLYHWRKIPGSTAAVYSTKSYANSASIRALKDYCKQQNIEASVENGLWPGSFRINRKVLRQPKVSIIIPFKDQPALLKKCLSSIFQKTFYDNYEIILVNNRSSQTETIHFLKSQEANERIKVLEFNDEFNFAAINNFASKYASGSHLLFLNNDTEVIAHNWISVMLSHSQREEVGAVGAKLLYPDNTVQHAGVILGVGGIANHAYQRQHPASTTYWGHLNSERDYSALTGACLMVSKELFADCGGFNEDLSIAYNDIDLCLKLIEMGKINVYTPYAVLYHYESVSRGYDVSPEKRKRLKQESEILRCRWAKKLDKDPMYNINLTKEATNFTLA